jgi:HEAT repeat protein
VHKLKAILLLSNLFFGAAFAASFTGSTALVVSELGPFHAFLGQFLGGTIFFIANRFKLLHSNKIERRFVQILLFHICLLIFINSGLVSTKVMAYIWVSISTFSIASFHWLTSELISRHVEPARVSAFFNYGFAMKSSGALIVLAILKFFIDLTDAKPYIQTEIICYAVGFSLLLYGEVSGLFIPIGVVRKKNEAPPQKALDRKLSICLILIAMLLFLGRGFEAHALRVILKTGHSDFRSIQQFLALLYISGHGIATVLSLLFSQLSSLQKVSPFKFLKIFHGIILAATAYAFFYPNLKGMLGISVIRYSLLSALVYPALERIYGSIAKHLRVAQRTTQLSIENTIGASFMLVSLPLFDLLAPETEVQSILGCVLLLSVIAEIVIAKVIPIFRSQLIDQLGCQDEDGIRASVIGLGSDQSPQALAAICNVGQTTTNLLTLSDTVKALSFFKTRLATSEIINILDKSSESIQLDCLDALTSQKNHEGVNFVINASTGKNLDLGPELRLRAGKNLAKIYGKNAIPLLIDGLSSEHDRSIANSLETLFLFRDPSLIPILKQFLTHSNPRISTNAAMDLFNFRAERSGATKVIEDAAQSGDIARKSSALYAIGFLRHKRFHEIIRTYAAQKDDLDSRILPPFIWAVIQLGLTTRIQLDYFMGRIVHEDLPIRRSFCYFFEKLPPAIRQEFIIGLVALQKPLLQGIFEMLSLNELAFSEEREMVRALLSA